jgi:hypothetical protein
MKHPHLARLAFSLLAVIATAQLAWSQSKFASDDDSNDIYWYKAPLPLGADGFRLEPAHREFYVLSCVEDRRFNRLQVSRVRKSPFVIDASGDVWKNYPSEVTFRVTATAMDPGSLKSDIDKINEPGDLNSFLLGLSFRLKVFEGLTMRVIKPSAIHMIGVPSDVPFEERVYRVSFATGDFPVDARLVMEVISPGGKLLSRFHLELL